MGSLEPVQRQGRQVVRHERLLLSVILSLALVYCCFFPPGYALPAIFDTPYKPGTNRTAAHRVDHAAPEVIAPRLAVMIVNDASASPNLVPVMLHFAAVLGPVWSLVLFAQEEHWKMPHSPAFVRAVQRGQIEIRFLPPATEVTTSQHMSDFLTRPWIWEQVSSAHRVLLFQLDSIICSNSLYTVEAFFEYDFIGAPTEPGHGAGYNGGLSLRNPKLFAAIAKEVDFRQSSEDSEDLWFYAEAVKRGLCSQPSVLPRSSQSGQSTTPSRWATISRSVGSMRG
ncbi:hypothetical protein PG995_011600 [Apiospora arundinis]